MSQASNRYQIDAISKGISSIEDQYNMAYENVMNAYKDTRDDKILEEWEKTSKQYENDIIAVTKERANEIVKGKTY
jgi:L-rhamnose isomerase